MLANSLAPSLTSGALGQDVHLPATSLHELLEFIGAELPKWRDRADRKPETSETALTSQLCAHLNSAARLACGWDMFQFRVEEPDEVVKGRKVDLISAPSGGAIWIDGRRHVDFDTIMPIECKRLPTPKGTGRDEREYVFSEHSSTGGIQRFKDGNHGAEHGLAGMIGYVQRDSNSDWAKTVHGWINGLVVAGKTGWNSADHIQLESDDTTLRTARLRSTHTRAKNLRQIVIRHFWVQMH